jgi:hypothetical protein
MSLMPRNEALELLRRNDPSQTDVGIRLREWSDNALSEALQANNHVNYIDLDITGVVNVNSNWNSLLRVLATRENLEKFYLFDFDYHGVQSPHRDRVTPFLLALQQNHSIRTLILNGLQLSGDSLAAFLDSATSVTAVLELVCCEMDAPGGAFAIAAALQRNTNIQELMLAGDIMYTIPILNSLASNTSIRVFMPCINSLPVSLAVKKVLVSNTTMQRFVFKADTLDIEVDIFEPIAQGLIQSKSVTAVDFDHCEFDNQEVALLFSGTLESKSNLQVLCLDDCSVHVAGQEKFRAAIFSHLQPHSLLRTLELVWSRNFNLSNSGFETCQEFNRLLTAVESSPLECFSIGKIVSRECCLALIASIPKMQLETLGFDLNPGLQDLKGVIMQAIKRNTSLRTVVAKVGYSEDWLGKDDRKKLNSYSLRNKSLAQWIENPTLVPKAAWSEALDIAQMTGPDTIFRILLALAPSLGPFEGEKCQKRRRSDPSDHHCLGSFVGEKRRKRLHSDPPGHFCDRQSGL